MTIEDPLPLESGARLPGVRLAYETWGQRAADGSNAVLVLHALTGDSHVAGPAGPGHPTPGWWDALVGPGRALDTDRWFVVAPNVLGGCQGSTGPSSPGPDGAPWGSRFPYLTVRDQVAAEAALADALSIERWAAVIGGSVGGMRALEWAVGRPERTGSLLVLAAPAAASAEQIAWGSVQIEAIRSDPGWRGGDYHHAPPGAGPHRGLGQARRIAHITYRSEPELAARFGREPQPGEEPGRGGRYQVESYLDHHAGKLVRRFDAGSYVALTGAMNGHDVGRGRGGVERALRRAELPALVAGVDSDRLYPLSQQRQLAELLPGCDGLRTVESPYGHDGFLIETDQVASLVRELERITGRGAEPLVDGVTAGGRLLAADGPLLCVGAVLPDALRTERLLWFHSVNAGTDPLLAAGPWPAGALLTRTVGRMGERIAQYVLGWVLAECQAVPEYVAQHARAEWRRLPTELVAGQTALVYGTGRIGGAVAGLLRSCGVRTVGVGRTSAPARSAASTRVTPCPPISTGSASGRNPAALTATVTEPGTSSPNANSPAPPEVPVARTSPRTSVTMTIAPSTGVPDSAALTVPASPLVPESRMSKASGSGPTTTVDACGWKPSAEAIRT
ncbi:homoserine O-acetyltransferase [Streptomyces sp. WAC04770]|nr:homoserine O-acetyltransferase [Streptomyces sp. WAC04770]